MGNILNKAQQNKSRALGMTGRHVARTWRSLATRWQRSDLKDSIVRGANVTLGHVIWLRSGVRYIAAHPSVNTLWRGRLALAYASVIKRLKPRCMSGSTLTQWNTILHGLRNAVPSGLSQYAWFLTGPRGHGRRLPVIPAVSKVVGELSEMLCAVEKGESRMTLIDKIVQSSGQLAKLVRERHVEDTSKSITIGTLFDRSNCVLRVYKDGFGQRFVMLSETVIGRLMYEYSNGKYEELKPKRSDDGLLIHPLRVDVEYMLDAGHAHKLFVGKSHGMDTINCKRTI